jgi:hypothetical protein
MNQFIYQEVTRSKIFFFLVLYLDDIMLETNDKNLSNEMRQFLSKNFDMKDIGETFYVIDIKIYRDKFKGVLSIS